MKKYKFLANAVFIIHVLVIMMLIFGTILCRMLNWYKDFHLMFLGTVLISQLIFLGCPLTTLESGLRNKYDSSMKFSGSLTSFLVYKIFGVRINPITVIALLVIVLLGNILFFILGGLNDLQPI